MGMNHYKAKILFENMDSHIKEIEDEVEANYKYQALELMCDKYRDFIKEANYQVSVEVVKI